MMEAKTVAEAKRKTDEEYMQEIDQMAIEIRAMLDESSRTLEHARRIGEENKHNLDRLEKQYLCGKD